MKPAMTIKGRFCDCSWTSNKSQLNDRVKNRKWKLTALPTDDRKVVAITWPSKFLLSLPQLLELHSKLTLPDFIIGEHLL